MMSVIVFFSIIAMIWVFLRTVSYGLWTWQQKNRLGAVMLWILALSVLILPAYSTFRLSYNQLLAYLR